MYEEAADWHPYVRQRDGFEAREGVKRQRAKQAAERSKLGRRATRARGAGTDPATAQSQP